MKKHLFLVILTGSITYTIDNPHFYRSTYFWGEPRLEFPWLMSIDVSLGGANTKTSFNKHGKKTELLNIYGPHNMHNLGANVPDLNPENPLDKILINLNALPNRENFGKLLFDGKFQIIESYLNVYQNLINGFFFQLNIPLRKLKITRTTFQDLSPDDTLFPNKNTPEWQDFLYAFPQILERFNLSLRGADRIGFGDLSVLAGWTINYENTSHVDYFDVSAKIGILFPTGKRKSIRHPFDLPQGYNGFYAVPVKFDCATGAFEWLTLGMHLGALFFIKRNQTLRLKTSENQNGFIKLAIGKTAVDQGTILDTTLYLKADHIMKGLSLLLGYSYNKKDRDYIELENTTLFDPIIVNRDKEFKAWRMHTLHFLVEYDFAEKYTDIGLRLAFFYNRVLTGQRIFNAHIKAVNTGIDMVWIF